MESSTVEPWQCPQCTTINKEWPDYCEVCFYNKKEETENVFHVQTRQQLEELSHDERPGYKEREVIRIVIVGKTGNGKSSTARSLTRSEKFQSQLSATSCTRNCMYDSGNVDDVRVEVVDTPGLFDTCFSTEESIAEISKCSLLSAPGPHAFLLTLGFQRFTPEERDTLVVLEKLFGKEFYKYVVIVFTGFDSLTNMKSSVDTFIKNIPGSLRELIDRCNGRYTYIDNTDSIEDSKKGALRILDLVKKMKNSNSNEYFSNDLIKKAEGLMKEREKEFQRNEECSIDKQANRREFVAPYRADVSEANLEDVLPHVYRYRRYGRENETEYEPEESRGCRDKVREDVVNGKGSWIPKAIESLGHVIKEILYKNRNVLMTLGLFALKRFLRL